MKSVANALITVFMCMFWAFRVVITYMAGVGKEFIIKPIDNTVEIVLLFVTLICIVLVIKRQLIGGIIYLLTNLGYYGVNLYKSIEPVIKGEQFAVSNAFTAFISFVAVILSIVVVMDLLSDKTKKPADTETDWFFNNKDLDRKTDSREDKNNYRIY